MSSYGAGLTAPAAYAAPARNIILVHGAFADGSGWKGVSDRLTAKGYKVQVVQEPQTSEEEDVQAVKRAIALADGPVVLVGHSYGGVLITDAGDDPKVSGVGVGLCRRLRSRRRREPRRPL